MLGTCFTRLSLLEEVLAQGSTSLQQQNTKDIIIRTQGIRLTPNPNPLITEGEQHRTERGICLLELRANLSQRFPEAKNTKHHPPHGMYIQMPLQLDSHKEVASWILYLPKNIYLTFTFLHIHDHIRSTNCPFKLLLLSKWPKLTS